MGQCQESDSEKPDIRSRLVGRESNTGKNDELYALTPALEALSFVISSAATWTSCGEQRHVMVDDVRRAFFHTPTNRDIYNELTAED